MTFYDPESPIMAETCIPMRTMRPVPIITPVTQCTTESPEHLLGRPLNPGDPTKQIGRDARHELHARLKVFAARLASPGPHIFKSDEQVQAARDILQIVERDA